MSNRVLLVEDDKAIRFGVARHLKRCGFVVAEAESCAVARERFRAFDPQAVVTDFRLPDGEALELITDFRREKPTLPIFVFTGYGSIELAVRAVKTGADNLLTKPVDMDKLVDELRRAFQAPPSSSGVHRASLSGPGALFALKEEIERLKDVECSLLILGETGTGKTMLARWLHEASRRSDKPFIDLNCAGLARDLVESELFGHERGAFTSAHAAKAGMFELADGGTLFLDEIGDIDVTVQPKVLKAIEEKRFRRMGSVRECSVDVRIIAATHRDLREAARTSAFRSDLYYRLSTVTIAIPALRDRRPEIPGLARDLVASLSAKIGRAAPELSADADAALVGHAWPGNVRELRNVVERALHLTHASVITARDLGIDEASAYPSEPPVPSSTTLQEVERAHIERALATHGHVGDAARSLGISRSSMYLKLKAYGLLPARGSVRLKAAGGDGS
ncbi:MAG TPA: sigma-54 dependent transcriptional regulator [Polyangiaceae bacterium]|jgi:DNA-binding NtrC family response regulator|nr:sigma-54 dependent transcriptional regulator [Polyangiaceae bacterium]